MGVRAPEAVEEPELHRPQRIGPHTASAVGLAVVLFALLLSNGRPILPPGDWWPAARQPAALAGKGAASLLSAAGAALFFLAVGRRHSVERARLAAVFLALGTTVWAASQAWNGWALGSAIVCLAVLWMAKADEGGTAWAARAGLPLGLIVAAHPANLALAATLAAGVVVRWPARAGPFLLWALPGAALALSRERIFGAGEGSLWLSGPTGDWGISHLSLLASPDRGLLVFAPVVIVAAVGMAGALRRGERWLPATFGAGCLAHWLAMGFRRDGLGEEAWGSIALNSALPLLMAFLPEGLEALPRLGTWLGVLAIGIQALGAFTYDHRWDRLQQRPSPSRSAALWDASGGPVAYYARRRVVILATPGWADGRPYVRRHPLVLFGAHGSRFSFAGDDVVVGGAEATAGDVHLQGAARVDGNVLGLREPGDALFLRVEPSARRRPLELRIVGRGRGVLAVGESTYWSPAPRSKEYPVAGEFRVRHPYDFKTSGGADVVITLARAGDLQIRDVALVGPADAADPIELAP